MFLYLKIIGIVIFFIFTLSSFGFCQQQSGEESITITTYYPSPYGVYKELRLYPNSSPNDCGINNKGAMYYNDSDNQTYVCNGDSWNIMGGIPSGMIAMFDASCPSGWTRFAALDGRFPQGAATYGDTGGSTSKNLDEAATETAHSSGGWQDWVHRPTAEANRMRYSAGNNDPPTSMGYNVYRTISDIRPPYLNVVWCKKD